MVSREQKVNQSVQDYLKAQLESAGYNDPDHFKMLDAWDGSALETPLTTNYIAAAYSFDDGGKAAEVGSNLIRRLYTVEFFVFAKNATWGRNLASLMQTAIEDNGGGNIPLLDIGEPGQPEIDVLTLENVSAQREPVALNPPAWQKFVWTVRARLWDEYFATLV